MAFQAQSAPNYQGAASDIGGMFARKGKAFLTWAQAKRDRDERAAAIEVQRGRETRATIMGALKEAGRLGAEERRMGFAKDKWEEGSAKRISDLKNSLNYDHRVEVSRKAAQYDAYVKKHEELLSNEPLLTESQWLAQPGNALKTTAVSFKEASNILELGGEYTGAISNANMEVTGDDEEVKSVLSRLQDPPETKAKVTTDTQPPSVEPKPDTPSDLYGPDNSLSHLDALNAKEVLEDRKLAAAAAPDALPPASNVEAYNVTLRQQRIEAQTAAATEAPPEPKPIAEPPLPKIPEEMNSGSYANVIESLLYNKDGNDVSQRDLVQADAYLKENSGEKLSQLRRAAVKSIPASELTGAFLDYYDYNEKEKTYNFEKPQNNKKLIKEARKDGASTELKEWLKAKENYDAERALIDKEMRSRVKVQVEGGGGNEEELVAGGGHQVLSGLGKLEGDEAPPSGKYNGETLTSETGGSDANVAVLDPAKEAALVSEETDTLASAVASTPKPSYKEFGVSGKEAASLFFGNPKTKAAKAYTKYEESGHKDQAALTEAYKQTYGFGGFPKLKGGTAAGLREWYDNTKGNSTQRKAFLKYIKSMSITNPIVINQMTEKLVNELYQTPEVVQDTGGEGTPGSDGELIKILDANPNYENYVPVSVTKKSKAGHAWFDKLSDAEQEMINDLDANLQSMEGGYFRVRGWDVNNKTLFGRSVLLSKEENADVKAKAANNQNTVLSRNTAIGFTLNKYKEKLVHVNAPLVWENVDENIKKQWFSSFWQSGTSGTHRTRVQELNKLYKDNASDADIESKINEVNTAFYGAGGAHMGGRVYTRKMKEAYDLDGGAWVKEHLAGRIKSASGGDGALFNQEKWLAAVEKIDGKDVALRPDTKPIFDRAVTAARKNPEHGVTIEYTKDGDLVYHANNVSEKNNDSAYFKSRAKHVSKGSYFLRAELGKKKKGDAVIGEGTSLLITEKQMVNGAAWYKVSYGNKSGWVHHKGVRTTVRFDATGSQRAFTDLMINAPQMKNRKNKLSKELGLAQRSLQSVTLKGPASVNVRDDSANEVRKIYRGTPVLVDNTRTKTMKVAGNYINYIWVYGAEGENGGWISKNTVTTSAPKTVAGRNIYRGNVAAFDDKHNKVSGQSFPKYADIVIALKDGEPMTREIDGKKYVKAKVKEGTTWYWGSASSLQVKT